MNQMTIEVIPDYIFVRGIRYCIAQIAHDYGFDSKEVYQIKTAIDEICNNAIEHGSRDRDAKIKIECRFNTDKIEFKVTNRTNMGDKQFHLNEVLKQSIKLSKEEIAKRKVIHHRKGRGLIIVKEFMDELHAKSNKNITEVMVIKNKNMTER